MGHLQRRAGHMVMWLQANHIPRLAERPRERPIKDMGDVQLGGGTPPEVKICLFDVAYFRDTLKTFTKYDI